jgi:cell division protein FtsQ
MWDKPRFLNAAAGFFVGMALFAASIAGLYWLLHSPAFLVRSVELANPVTHAPRAELEALMSRTVGRNFFAAPIGALRGSLERVPWVRKAAVRRVWPDRLEVTIEEDVALARWGGEALVNTHGERFAGSVEDRLPTFIGPTGAEAEMTLRYMRFMQVLTPLGAAIDRLVLSPRHAWQIILANGMQLTLGRDADVAEQRLERFVGAYAATPGVPPARAVVDLRYPNGFAIRVKG